MPTSESGLRCCAIVFALALVAGCGDGGGGGDGVSATSASSLPPPRAVEQSDLQIAAAIYQGVPRTPADFYSEASSNAQGTVATLHVKNTGVS